MNIFALQEKIKMKLSFSYPSGETGPNQEQIIDMVQIVICLAL